MIFPPLNVENNSLITSAKLSAQLFHCFNFFHNCGTKKDANITFFSLQTKSANRCFLSLCRSRVLTDGGHYGQAMEILPIFSYIYSILLVIIVALPDSVDYLCGGWVVTYSICINMSHVFYFRKRFCHKLLLDICSSLKYIFFHPFTLCLCCSLVYSLSF